MRPATLIIGISPRLTRSVASACLALALCTTTGCGGESPTGPSSIAADAVGEAAVAPLTLRRGDVYRIRFRVDASAWGSGQAPNILDANISANSSASGASNDCATARVFDGTRSLGSRGIPDCGFVRASAGAIAGQPNLVIDFASIRSGTIDGRIDVQILADRFTADALYRLDSLIDQGGGFAAGINGGVTITSQEIFR